MNMKTTFLVAALGLMALLSSCSKSPPLPRKAQVPVQANPVDLSSVERAFEATDKRLDDAYEASSALLDRINQVKEDVDGASLKAEEAFASGLEAGSVKALELTQSIEKLKADLNETRRDSALLSDNLKASLNALDIATNDLKSVRSDLAKMESENANLRKSLDEANSSIGESLNQISELKTRALDSAAELKLEAKWKKIWLAAFLFLFSSLLIYGYTRIKFGGIIR